MINYNKSNSVSNPKLILAIICSILLITFSVISPEKYLVLSTKINYYSGFFERSVVQTIPSFIRNSQTNSELITNLKKENEQLTIQIKNLNSKYIYFMNIEKENKELRNLLNIKTNPNIRSITTVLIKNENIISTKTLSNTIILPLGAQDNIKTKSLIINSSGVVGYITNVYNTRAVVRTFLDHQFKISAFTEKSKYNVIISGNGTKTPDIQVYSETYNLQKNELITTSGLEGLFPRNIPIGTVFQEPKSKTWKVKLFADFSTINYVFVVK